MKFLFKMSTLPRFLLLLIACAHLNFIHDVKCEKALIFNFEKQQLITPGEVVENGISSWYEVSSCVLACPPSSSNTDKNQNNYERSINKNGVFSRFVYEKGILKNDIDICSTSFKPTTVLNESTNSIETGYELYYKDGTIFSLMYEKYNQLNKVYGKKANKEEVPNDSFEVKKIDDNKNTKFQVVGSNTKWTYFWISVLSIKGAGARRTITFTKDSIPTQSKFLDDFSKICEGHYALGDESQNVISREKVAGLREIVNRNTDFNTRLRIIQIMPIHYLHTHSAKLATCTELNLAFIWENVAIGYRKLDSYLYALYKAWPTRVNIIFGVQGAIDTKFDELSDTSILKNYTIPAPEIFYRIVEYIDTDITFSVIIVFHNTSSTLPNEKRICSVDDEVSGWYELKLINPTIAPFKLGLVYGCPVTPERITKLQADYTVTRKMPEFRLTETIRRRITPSRYIIPNKYTRLSTFPY